MADGWLPQGEWVAIAGDPGLAETVCHRGARPSDWMAAIGLRYNGMETLEVVSQDNARHTVSGATKETMAMGLPITASAPPGRCEILKEACARRFLRGDLSALAGLRP